MFLFNKNEKYLLFLIINLLFDFILIKISINKWIQYLKFFNTKHFYYILIIFGLEKDYEG